MASECKKLLFGLACIAYAWGTPDRVLAQRVPPLGGITEFENDSADSLNFRAEDVAAAMLPGEDCNQNGILDDTEQSSGRFFMAEVPGLIGSYYGFAGIWHSSVFDFGQPFLRVDHAWLRLGGLADMGYTSDLSFHTSIDSGPNTDTVVADLNEYEICIPVLPSASSTTGTGTIELFIVVYNCCDHLSRVNHAELWFDAIPTPPPADLSIYASFQSCYGEVDLGAAPACKDSDIDLDGDVDLRDFDLFLMVFVGP